MIDIAVALHFNALKSEGKNVEFVSENTYIASDNFQSVLYRNTIPVVKGEFIQPVGTQFIVTNGKKDTLLDADLREMISANEITPVYPIGREVYIIRTGNKKFLVHNDRCFDVNKEDIKKHYNYEAFKKNGLWEVSYRNKLIARGLSVEFPNNRDVLVRGIRSLKERQLHPIQKMRQLLSRALFPQQSATVLFRDGHSIAYSKGEITAFKNYDYCVSDDKKGHRFFRNNELLSGVSHKVIASYQNDFYACAIDATHVRLFDENQEEVVTCAKVDELSPNIFDVTDANNNHFLYKGYDVLFKGAEVDFLTDGFYAVRQDTTGQASWQLYHRTKLIAECQRRPVYLPACEMISVRNDSDSFLLPKSAVGVNAFLKNIRTYLDSYRNRIPRDLSIRSGRFLSRYITFLQKAVETYSIREQDQMDPQPISTDEVTKIIQNSYFAKQKQRD